MNNNFYGTGKEQNLSFDEEVMLSKKIQAGNDAKEILAKNGSLSYEDRVKLESLAAEGDLAFERLVYANVPRAMKFASETWQKNRSGADDLEDYRQVAMGVICSCARVFDWKKGCRFGTLAHQCLQREMLRENARMCYVIRVPEERLMQLPAAKKDAAADVSGAEAIGSALKKLIDVCGPQRSLQDPVGMEEDEAEFGDYLPDPSAVTAAQIEESIDHEEMVSRLYKALESLPDDERMLLMGRAGFFGETQTLSSFVGTAARSISGVQKKQIAAEKHLRELYISLPMAG